MLGSLGGSGERRGHLVCVHFVWSRGPRQVNISHSSRLTPSPYPFGSCWVAFDFSWHVWNSHLTPVGREEGLEERSPVREYASLGSSSASSPSDSSRCFVLGFRGEAFAGPRRLPQPHELGVRHPRKKRGKHLFNDLTRFTFIVGHKTIGLLIFYLVSRTILKRFRVDTFWSETLEVLEVNF